MSVKKGIISAIFFILIIGLTFYAIFKDNNIGDVLNIIRNVDAKFIIIAALCMANFVVSEGTNVARALNLLDSRIKFWDGIRYAAIGFFFSSITPAASGGNPVQIYYMKKDGLPIGKSALAIFTEFFSYQLVTITIALIGFITNYNFIEESIGNIKYFLILGLIVNIGILLIILLSIFYSNIMVSILDFICKILKKMHVKKVDSFREKCINQINEYKDGGELLVNNKKLLLKIVSTTTIQIILYHSIPYFIYLSLGLSGASYLRFVALQAVLHIAVSYMPLPGAVGASEGGFILIYSLMFPNELLNSAMLLSRGISFYLFVIITGLMILFFNLFRSKKFKQQS